MFNTDIYTISDALSKQIYSNRNMFKPTEIQNVDFKKIPSLYQAGQKVPASVCIFPVQIKYFQIKLQQLLEVLPIALYAMLQPLLPLFKAFRPLFLSNGIQYLSNCLTQGLSI